MSIAMLVLGAPAFLPVDIANAQSHAGDSSITAPRDITTVAAAFDGLAADVTNSIRAMVNSPRQHQPMPSSSSPSSRSSSGKGEINVLMGQDADPNFERWQKDAQEKLKAEAQGKIIPPHPLALAHPGKSVVVCEAGCRSTSDEIVYVAVIVPAVLPQSETQGQLEATSSGGAPGQQLADGEVSCIAGCYVRPERNRPNTRRKADVDPKPDVTPAQRYAEVVRRAMHSALAAAPAPVAPAHRVPPVVRAPVLVALATQPVAKQAIKKQPILEQPVVANALTVATAASEARTASRPRQSKPEAIARLRITRVERGVNGAIVQARQPALLNRAQTYAGVSVRGAKSAAFSVVHGWTAKVIPAPATLMRAALRETTHAKRDLGKPDYSKTVMRTKVLTRMTEVARLRRTASAAWQVRLVEF